MLRRTELNRGSEKRGRDGRGNRRRLNTVGLRRVVITGAVNELPKSVFNHVSESIVRGTLWARFGELKIEKAPRRRKSGPRRRWN